MDLLKGDTNELWKSKKIFSGRGSMWLDVCATIPFPKHTHMHSYFNFWQVNVLEPHPNAPILATSGLDHDIKVWMPMAPQPTKLEGLKRVRISNCLYVALYQFLKCFVRSQNLLLYLKLQYRNFIPGANVLWISHRSTASVDLFVLSLQIANVDGFFWNFIQGLV
jgi:hypothetical protein